MPHAAPHATLVDLLRAQAAQLPDKQIYGFLLDGEANTAYLTYQELDRRAQMVGALLQAQGASGQRVLLLYPPGLDYIAAFFGCLYAGAVAVPAYPPNPARLDRTLPRLQAIVGDARPTIALTTAPILAVAEFLAAQAPEFKQVQWFATDTLADTLADSWQAPSIAGESLAFLQYTSGSTATPKGVMLSHANLLHNSEVIHQGFGTTSESRGVFWLPFYHDMGLIGGLIQPIYCGGTSLLLSPVDFLQRPLRWLQAISSFRATISGGPNFAYDLCVRKITPEQRDQLDLSSWGLAFNGAEPIRSETLDRFVATFAPCGFRREAFYPCYGLAEATLMVSGVAPLAAPLVRHFDTTALEARQVAEAGASASRPAQTLVASGQPLQQVAIVQPDTQVVCPPGTIGEIWVASGSIAQGYWERPTESAYSFGARITGDTAAGPFLRTGDLGFLHEGELFVTGRIKDLIIIRGRNHYPQDIELTVERCHPVLRPGCGAAVSIEVGGEERLVVVQEIERQPKQIDVEAVASAIRQAVAQAHELHVYAVALIKTGSIPKTSSGKIQRHACRAGFLNGTLETVGTSQLEETQPSATAELSRAVLLAAAPAERQPLLAAYLQAQVAAALRVAPGQIALERPLSAFGLDSLMAVELQHTLETDLGVVVSMVSFLQDQSLAALATELLAQLEAGTSTPPLLRASTGEASAPLSPGQRALWFLHQLAPESAAYTIASAVQISGTLDTAALERSFYRLAERHPALRTTFRMQQGDVAQVIHPEPLLGFTRHDATEWSSDELHTWLREAAQRPFDLANGPLLRLDLLTRAAEQHVLLLAVHHSVSDLWSLALLAHELGVVYPAECAGTPAALPPAPLPYSDYVRWQNELLAGPEGERLWNYWQAQLAGAPTILNLPTDRPRPPVQTYNGAVHSFMLDSVLTAKLKTLAEARGTTLYTLLLAAFQTLLYRYSGQHEFLIGTPTAGRNRAELNATVGYFVNSLVLRANLAGTPSFSQLVERTRQTSLAAFAHQEYPFVTLAERLELGRDLSRSPLFQVMFAFQKVQSREQTDLTAFAVGAETGALTIGGLQFAPLPLEQRVAQFDLSLAIGEVQAGLAATLEYNSDLFDATTAQRMAQHFATIVAAAVANPAQIIDDMPLLSAAERQQVLVEWNNTSADIPADAGIHTLFEAQAVRTPDAPAVIYGDSQLSYRELNQRATVLAQHLRGLGVGPETLVGICTDRSLAMMVGVLAILKAGGAYLPLDPTYPAERLGYMLREARPIVVLTETEDGRQKTEDGQPIMAGWQIATTAQGVVQHELIPNTQYPTPVLVDLSDWQATSQLSTPGAQLPTPGPDQAACVIYTSGSTGQPKGVVLTHRAIVNLISSFLRSYEPGTSDRMLPLTSIASASFVGEIFPLLCAGGALVLPSSLEVLDFEALYRLITQQHVTMLSTVPSLIARLNGHASELPELRLLLSGGEALARGDLDKLVQTTTISNGYGLTETTVCSTFYHVDPRRADTGSYIPIGRPLINTQAYILDARMHPVPVGVPGELYIGGVGLARGYFDDPALTAERFVPFWGQGSGVRGQQPAHDAGHVLHTASRSLTPDPRSLPTRLYRTGDRARWLPDGLIEFVGRLDHQVKIRGFRIELGEIEAALGAHPAVREVVVLAREDVPGEKRLVAYVVPTTEDRGRKTEDQTPTDTEPTVHRPPSTVLTDLRTHLRERLPTYMIPAAFVLLDSLPLTPNGKVDLRLLPAPSADRASESGYLAPRSEIERAIAATWQAALHVQNVGLHDNFFDLGGHSLLLVQVHNQLKESYPQLTLIDMFRHPTVGTLAAHLSSAAPAADTSAEFQERAQKQKAFRDRRKELAKGRG